MIELTHEQWHAITHEENPTVIEPESKTAYVVVPKEDFDRQRAGDADVARALRLAWMTRMKLDDEEIAESMRDDPPVSVEEEMKQIRAIDNLDKITPPGELLRTFAIKY
jgi:hypothetical protein